MSIAAILREVSSQVISSEDVILTTPEFRLQSSLDLESAYEKLGTLFLEKLEQMERVERAREICNISAHTLGIRSQFQIDIAVALLGVGECGEKSALAGVKLSLQGIDHVRVFCNNSRAQKEMSKKSVDNVISAQGHQFIVRGVSAESLRKHHRTKDALEILKSCNGELIDPLFQFRAPAKELFRQRAFKTYFAMHQITYLCGEYLVEPSKDTLVKEGNIDMHNAQKIHAHAKSFILQERDPLFCKGARADFIAQKKTELLLDFAKRHFPQFDWRANIEQRGVETEGTVGEIDDLKFQLNNSGFSPKTLTKKIRRTTYKTLSLHNPSFAPLYQFEIALALPGFATTTLAHIASHLISPFRGLASYTSS